MIDAAVLVFHHTGVVSLVRGDYRLHDDGPHMVTDLKVWGEKKPKLQWLPSRTGHDKNKNNVVQIELLLLVKYAGHFNSLRIGQFMESKLNVFNQMSLNEASREPIAADGAGLQICI